ncbi:hypothetical protein, partial [Anaeromyxobacter sp. SG26]
MTDAYPLAALLGLREREEEAARAALAAALAEEGRARRERDEQRALLDDVSRRASASGVPTGVAAPAATLQTAAGHSARLRREEA